MRVIINLFVLFSITLSANAQSKISDFSIVGGFGNPVLGFNFKHGTTMNMGGEGAAVFGNSLFLGGFGMGTTSVNDYKSTITGFTDYHVESSYGGVWIGYILRLNKRFYINVSGKFGGGEIALNHRKLQTTVYDKISVVKPQLGIDMKILRILSLTAGAGYTHFGGVDVQGQGAGHFNDFELFAGVRMGWW